MHAYPIRVGFGAFFQLCSMVFLGAASHGAELGLSASSYLGDESDGDEVRGAAFLSDGTLVLAANLSEGIPSGVSPTVLSGATAASRGTLLRLSSDGRTLLSVTRVADAVYDLSYDDQDNLYVAAGYEGVLKLPSNALSLTGVRQAGQFVYRVDAAGDGHVVTLVPSNTGDPDNKAGSGLVSVFDASFTAVNAFSGGYTQTTDVAIDGVSQTIFTIGWANRFTWTPELGPSTPVDIPGLRGVPYNYDPGMGINARWQGYDWQANVWLDPEETLPNPRYINYPFSTDPSNLNENRYPLVVSNNMADTRGYRVEMGGDGNLYAAFEFDGGNTPVRWSPFDLTVTKSPVGGDIFHQTFNTSTVPKVFFARYAPLTGEVLRSQWYTNRLNNPIGPAHDNTVRMEGGAFWADDSGRVYIGGVSAYGLPMPGNPVHTPNPGELTFNPQGPNAYIGGAYFMVFSADFATRLYTTRLSEGGTTRAITARTLSGESEARVAWAGDTNLSGPTFTFDAVQPAPGYGSSDGTFGVLGGGLFDGSDGYQFDFKVNTPYVSSGTKFRDSSQTKTVVDLDGDGADDSIAGYAFSMATPFSPTSGYSGPAFYGGFLNSALNATNTSLDSSTVGTSEIVIRAQPSSGETEAQHGVFFFPRSEFAGLDAGDLLDFPASGSLSVSFSQGLGGTGRFLVRNGSTFYVSEATFNNSASIPFVLDVEDGSWAPWSIPASMNFDGAAAPFAMQNFGDITGVGYIMDTDPYDGNRFFMKWRGLTAEMRLNGANNQPPSPSGTLIPQRGRRSLSIVLDGRDSIDSDGIVTFHTWTLDDGAKRGGPMIQHSYGAAGHYRPTLRVYDDGLAQAEGGGTVDVFEGLLNQTHTIFASFGGDAVNSSKGLVRFFSGAVNLDGDGTDDDGFFGCTFSDASPLSTGLRGTNIYGHLYGESIDGVAQLAERKVSNGGAEDAITVRLQAGNAAGGARHRGLFFLDKADFLGVAQTSPVAFGRGSKLAMRTGGHWDAMGSVRWMVREGTSYYVSEELISGGTNAIFTYTFTSATDHGRWAPYDPEGPDNANFPDSTAIFSTRQFSNVTAVGVFIERDDYLPNRVWYEIQAIESSGVFGAPVALYLDWADLHFAPEDIANRNLESTLWGAVATADGEFANELQATLALDPLIQDSAGVLSSERDGDHVVLRFPLRTHVDGVPWHTSFNVEASTDLSAGDWRIIFNGALYEAGHLEQGDVEMTIVETHAEHAVVEVRVPTDAPWRFFRIALP